MAKDINTIANELAVTISNDKSSKYSVVERLQSFDSPGLLVVHPKFSGTVFLLDLDTEETLSKVDRGIVDILVKTCNRVVIISIAYEVEKDRYRLVIERCNSGTWSAETGSSLKEFFEWVK